MSSSNDGELKKSGSEKELDEDELAELEEGEDEFAPLPTQDGGGKKSLAPPSKTFNNKRQDNTPPVARYGSINQSPSNLTSLLAIPEDTPTPPSLADGSTNGSAAGLSPQLASRVGSFQGATRSNSAEGPKPRTRVPSIGAPRAASNIPRPPTRPKSRVSSLRGPSRTGPSSGSIVQGIKTVRLSVIPGQNATPSEPASQITHAVSFAPKRLLDIENGTSIVVSNQQFLSHSRYQELDADGAIVLNATTVAPVAKEDAIFFEERGRSLQDRVQTKDVHNFETSSEVGVLGGAWRGSLRRIMMHSMDEVNELRLSRVLQLFLPFQTGYEAYIIGQLIEALDSGRKDDIRYVLRIAFQNRNVSRILLQQMGPRFDFLWHWYTQITWNRAFDAWGQFPIVGITSFPASENFPSTRDHAFASIFRIVLGEGNWITRVVTQNRQGLVTTDENNTSQNLAAESNGFELANRNQFGTHIGRIRTNEFRFHHRLPTDESIVRTFVAQPMPTMLNNGVVHQIRQLNKHWRNMLYQFSGNFAHQRMEQLNPFETLRFHVPVILVTLSTLRGRNKWDAKVLGPMVRKLQSLKPSMTSEAARALAHELKDNIAVPVCGGVAAISDPLSEWFDAIYRSCEVVEEEAKQLYQIVTSVEIGIRLGHDIITQMTWKVPSNRELKKAILNHILGTPTGKVSERRIRTAMNLVTPRDKRTLIELVKNGMGTSKPAQLLLGRAMTLLQRELRRDMLNETIRTLSMGDKVNDVEHDEWYWLEETGGRKAVYRYDAKVTGRDQHRFVHVDSGFEKFLTLGEGLTQVYNYVPVAEAISRAQRAFMNIELDHGKKFTLDAFMEFVYLRTPLRRLMIISQVHCEELDNARLNVLAEIQRANQVQVTIHDLVPGNTYYTYDNERKVYEAFMCEKEYTKSDPEFQTLARKRIVKVPPQSIIVIGGGPTGLTATMHCLENVLISGGVMKLYEARDAFDQGGSTFERAQIVRLDARWIAMLRYHLGTGFEDVYIPASGETDSQLGNTLPTQGFVEITIKDLENMLHVEVSKMWAKGLIKVYTDSKSSYDAESNTLTKLGEYLKVDDSILRRVNQDGNACKEYHSWKVVELLYVQALKLEELKLGEEYGIYIRREGAIIVYRLMGVDLSTKTYTFSSMEEGREDVKASATNLPSVYPKGTKRHAEVSKIVVESIQKGRSGGYVRDTLPMAVIKKQKFTLDVGSTHIVEAIGKPHGSKVHFSVTTYEPYGVCCMQGLKVSMGMHNFGEKRWGSGLIDDFRSLNDQNTRIIGDFTKMVRSAPIVRRMYDYITDESDKNWQTHFNTLVQQEYPQLLDTQFIQRLQTAVGELADMGPNFRRKTLQTRFFETGDNFYLGMEFTREYDRWKGKTAADLVEPLNMTIQDSDPSAADKRKKIGRFKGTLMHHIDRLWYDACLETIRTGDVYNPGARHRVPRLYLINSYTDTTLGKLPIGESFRLSDRPEEKYEVLMKGSKIVVRNVEGFISRMESSAVVKREGNLTRRPDGNRESRVSLATFPVGHYVNFRTMRLNEAETGYVFAFIGDEQATPHFMRYSGLTGACINAMLFNNFIKQAIDGIPFIDRFKLYSIETNWSNGEVVQRGTGANYGVDGFLRPGFSYSHGLDYLHSKVIEYRESEQDLDHILSRDWKIKFAASMVPCGMELNESFITVLYSKVQAAVFEKFIKEVKADKKIEGDEIITILRERYEAMSKQRTSQDYDSFWNEYLSGLTGVNDETMAILEDPHVFIARRLDQMCNQVIEFASKAYLYNQRISSELTNQPKPVDSIVDDFAVEAQTFANSLTLSAAFSASALAFRLVGTDVGNIFSAIVAAFNILISIGTMTNVSRYKVRNEEARVIFMDEKFQQVLKAVFSVMDRQTRDAYSIKDNPFVEHLETQVAVFYEAAKYYDYPEPTEFTAAYEELKQNINDPDAIARFIDLITSKFIADDYHVSSYMQEYLVNIYKTCFEMLVLLTTVVDRSVGNMEAKELYNRLTDFRPRLEYSLQRGAVRFGFLKQRRIGQWDCSAVFKYFWGLFCFSSRNSPVPFTPISIETLGIINQTKHLSGLHDSSILRREIREMEGLYWATRESDISSLIFVAGFAVFIASVVFTIARIVRIEVLEDVAFWAALASALSAILALFHFVRKFFLLLGLQSVLGKKAHSVTSKDLRDNIRRVRAITWTQILLTITRGIAAGAAAVALPWSVAQNGFGDEIALDDLLPFYIALGSVCMAIGSTIFFFLVEYVVRYNLNSNFGEEICESFRDEIENMYRVLAKDPNDIETKQQQEKETWEYVAREFLHRYRFDAVFAADRFGMILQYIQGGMDPRT